MPLCAHPAIHDLARVSPSRGGNCGELNFHQLSFCDIGPPAQTS